MRIKHKSIFSKLEKKEPFTKQEKIKYSPQKRNFIRGIQLKDKCDKKTAEITANEYFLLKNKDRKNFAKGVEQAIINEYPKRSVTKRKTGKLSPIKQNRNTELPTKEEFYAANPEYKQRTKVTKKSRLGGKITEKR